MFLKKNGHRCFWFAGELDREPEKSYFVPEAHFRHAQISVNAVSDYIRMAFPLNSPNIGHVVINSVAREELALCTGISATIIPNVLDFQNPPPKKIYGYFFQKLQKKTRILLLPYENTTNWPFLDAPLHR